MGRGQCAGDERRPHRFDKLYSARPRHTLRARSKIYLQSEIYSMPSPQLTTCIGLLSMNHLLDTPIISEWYDNRHK